MSVQVRVSYETDEELLQITKRLSDLEFVVSTSPQRGQYKRAYLKPRRAQRAVATPQNEAREMRAALDRLQAKYPARH